MDAPEISWRPLGQLFVEKGLLEEARLEHALTEQAASGGRLGEKLVELGYVSSTALARLLAEQYGVELTFDTGFGTGLRAELERRQDDGNGQPEPVLREEPMMLTLVEALPEPDQSDDGGHSPLAALEEQWAKLAAAEAQVAELEEQVASLIGQVHERDEQIATLSAALVDADEPGKKRRGSNGKSRS